jgi:hypothetical protein
MHGRRVSRNVSFLRYLRLSEIGYLQFPGALPHSTVADTETRIRFIEHAGKRILLVDFSGCTARIAEEISRKVPDVVTKEPQRSVLVLSDFSEAAIDKHAAMTFKETAVFDKPHIKKSALVGIQSLPREFVKEMQDFSRREFAIFDSRDAALAWLATD